MPKKNDNSSQENSRLFLLGSGVYQPILTPEQKRGKFVPPRGGSGARYLKIKEIYVSTEKKE
jgi:hypothetical protein